MGFSSFCCEIKILQAKNLELKSQSNLFVRCYLSAQNNKRIQLNTQEISSNSNLFWNQSFSLECLGSENSINDLKKQSVVFELRRRNTNSVLGQIRGSQLLGRAQIPWETVMESPEMELEKWVLMVSKKTCSVLENGVKPPSVKISMVIRVPEMEKKKMRNGRLIDGCCEEIACKCEDYEIFALVGAFEAL